MPRTPKRSCSWPGCPTLIVGRYCKRHATQHEQQRGNAAERGYDTAWTKIRKATIEQEPWCRRHKADGVHVPATEVDHIVPIRKGGTNERSNLQPLCASCHKSKHWAEDGRG